MKQFLEQLLELLSASPPTRGAWIETVMVAAEMMCQPSPPTRGRGLKRLPGTSRRNSGRSPPTRGAWIETAAEPGAAARLRQSPPHGGVD